MNIYIRCKAHVVYGIEGNVNFRCVGIIDGEGGVIVCVCLLRRDVWSLKWGCL